MPSPRSSVAVATSAACHAVAIVALFLLAHGAATGSLPRVSRAPLTLVALLPAPDPAWLEPIEPLRPSSIPVKETPPDVVVPKPDPAPAPEIAPAPVRAVKPPAAEPPSPTKPIVVEAPRPAPALVTVGAFPSPSPAVHAVEPPRAVQQAGFDAPAAHAPDVKLRNASVGAFDQAPASARPQAGSDRPNIV